MQVYQKGGTTGESQSTVDTFGVKSWKDKTGRYHRKDGPAIVYPNGSKSWYIHGRLHRLDGPAFDYVKIKGWFVNGEKAPVKTQEEFEKWLKVRNIVKELPRQDVLNLESKPYVNSNGDEIWFNQYEQIHRDDGPAIIQKDGSRKWYKDNELHRDDGPAIELSSGTKAWYKDGERHRDDGPAVIHSSGVKKWYKNGWLHRDDGPAYENGKGYKEWWWYGKPISQEEHENLQRIHKIDKELPRQDVLNLESQWFLRGPTMFVDPATKIKTWRYEGTLHRVSGPAVVYPDGREGWWWYGQRHRDGGPAMIWPDGTEEWYQNGKLHRDGGPAITHQSGSKEWWVNGKMHRDDGPAFEGLRGVKEWWIDDKQVSQQEYENWRKVRNIDKKLPRQDVLNLETFAKYLKRTIKKL